MWYFELVKSGNYFGIIESYFKGKCHTAEFLWYDLRFHKEMLLEDIVLILRDIKQQVQIKELNIEIIGKPIEELNEKDNIIYLYSTCPFLLVQKLNELKGLNEQNY